MSCYLDNASTTWSYPECIESVGYILQNFWYNPSNNYKKSQIVKNIIKASKETIAECINCSPEEIFFTSGASEGNAFIMHQREKTICSIWEHHNYMENKDVDVVPETFFEDLKTSDLMQEAYKQTFSDYCYSHMLVSNITGEIFDVNKQFNLAHKYGMLCACDMTQAFGNIPINMQEIDCDIAVFSGHKFHAPKGIGFMYIRKDMQDKVKPMITGTQQSGIRGGTENVAYINALALAAERACGDIVLKHTTGEMLTKKCIELLNESGVEWFPVSGNNGISSTFSFCLKGIESEVIQEILNEKDICVGTGSGCADGSMKRENALIELEIPDEYIGGFFRLSFSTENTVEDVVEAINAIITEYNNLTK